MYLSKNSLRCQVQNESKYDIKLDTKDELRAIAYFLAENTPRMSHFLNFLHKMYLRKSLINLNIFCVLLSHISLLVRVNQSRVPEMKVGDDQPPSIVDNADKAHVEQGVDKHGDDSSIVCFHQVGIDDPGPERAVDVDVVGQKSVQDCGEVHHVVSVVDVLGSGGWLLRASR